MNEVCLLIDSFTFHFDRIFVRVVDPADDGTMSSLSWAQSRMTRFGLFLETAQRTNLVEFAIRLLTSTVSQDLSRSIESGNRSLVT